MTTQPKPLSYGIVGLAIIVISVGLAAIVYALNLIPLDLLNIPAWIFGPLGVYTIVYSFAAGKDSNYYLAWGTIMFAVAIVSATYSKVNIFLVLGILVIVLAVMSIVVYMRGRK